MAGPSSFLFTLALGSSQTLNEGRYGRIPLALSPATKINARRPTPQRKLLRKQSSLLLGGGGGGGETTNKAKRVEAARQARSISQRSASLVGGEFVQVIIILLCGTISPSWTGCGPKPLTLEGSKFLQKSAYHSSDIVRGPDAKDEIRESDMAVY